MEISFLGATGTVTDPKYLRVLGPAIRAAGTRGDAMVAGAEAAKDEIAGLAGRQFDPKAVEILVSQEGALREMAALKCE